MPCLALNFVYVYVFAVVATNFAQAASIQDRFGDARGREKGVASRHGGGASPSAPAGRAARGLLRSDTPAAKAGDAEADADDGWIDLYVEDAVKKQGNGSKNSSSNTTKASTTAEPDEDTTTSSEPAKNTTTTAAENTTTKAANTTTAAPTTTKQANTTTEEATTEAPTTTKKANTTTEEATTEEPTTASTTNATTTDEEIMLTNCVHINGQAPVRNRCLCGSTRLCKEGQFCYAGAYAGLGDCIDADNVTSTTVTTTTVTRTSVTRISTFTGTSTTQTATTITTTETTTTSTKTGSSTTRTYTTMTGTTQTFTSVSFTSTTRTTTTVSETSTTATISTTTNTTTTRTTSTTTETTITETYTSVTFTPYNGSVDAPGSIHEDTQHELYSGHPDGHILLEVYNASSFSSSIILSEVVASVVSSAQSVESAEVAISCLRACAQGSPDRGLVDVKYNLEEGSRDQLRSGNVSLEVLSEEFNKELTNGDGVNDFDAKVVKVAADEADMNNFLASGATPPPMANDFGSDGAEDEEAEEGVR